MSRNIRYTEKYQRREIPDTQSNIDVDIPDKTGISQH